MTESVDGAFHSVRRGDVIAVRRYLAAGGSPRGRDAEGRSLLMVAAEKGHPEVVRLLVDTGADVRETWPGGWTPLARAAVAGSAPAVDVLLASGAEATIPLDSAPDHSLVELIRRQWPERERIIDALERAARKSLSDAV